MVFDTCESAAAECTGAEEYITLRKERLRDEKRDSTASNTELGQGSPIDAKIDGAWALICRSGSKLGYLPTDALLKVNRN